jgi:signal transduction histidine kinase/ABC-type amino acid transport substrate-binding protein
MKKDNFALIAAVVFLSLSTYLLLSGNASIKAKVISENKVIASASEYYHPPFCIVNESGNANGFSVELLKETLNAVDLGATFYIGPWSEIKNDLAEGKVQVLPLVERTPEMENVYDFSVPYKTTYGAVFIRKNQTGIRALSDLRNKHVIVIKGDNLEEFVNRINLSDNIITTTYEEAFSRLSDGEYDGIVAQDIMGSRLLKKLNISNVIMIAKIPEFRQDFAFAVKKGDSGLLLKLNTGMSKIISDGTYERVYQKWFDGEIAEISPDKEMPSSPKTAAELVVNYSQQLTIASENYIATNDEYWKNEYDAIGLKQDKAIMILKIYALEQKNAYLIVTANKIDQTNAKLVELELTAHGLVKEGKNEEARTLIRGNEYVMYNKAHIERIADYLSYLGVETKKSSNEPISRVLLQAQITQYSKSINDRFDALSKIPDLSEFIRTIIKDSIYEDLAEFDAKFSVIDGAWRSNISYYNRSQGTEDVTGVMIYSNYTLTDDKRRIMLALSKNLKTYAVSTRNLFINRYVTFENGIDSIYPKEWIFKAGNDDDFKNEIWYYIADPTHDPKREPIWTPVYYDSVLKDWMISLITPIYDGDEFKGVTGGDITLKDIYNQVTKYTYGGKGYSIIFSSDKNILVHPGYLSEIEKKGQMEELFSFSDIKEMGLSRIIHQINDDGGIDTFDDNGTEYTFIYNKLDSINWYYGFVIKSAYLAAQYQPNFNFSTNPLINSDWENQINEETRKSKVYFYNLEIIEIERLKAILDVFMKKDDYKRVFLEHDRIKLYEKSLPMFNLNNVSFGITNFNYINPDSTIFLRVHQQEQYGDSIKRITFQKSAESNSWGTGIEIGKTALALRVVHPYYDNTSLIGYVELGEDVHRLIQKLKAETSLDYGILVKKEFIDATEWETVRKTQNLRNNYDDLPEYVIIDSTGSELLFNGLCFTSERLAAIKADGSILGECDIGQKRFMTSGFTLVDASNSVSGAVVVIHDLDKFLASSQDSDIYNKVPMDIITYVFIICLIVLGCVLYLLDLLKIVKIRPYTSMILLSTTILIILILFVINTYALTRTITDNALSDSAKKISLLADSKKQEISVYLNEQKEKLEIMAAQQEISNEELATFNILQDDIYDSFVTDSDGIIIRSTDLSQISQNVSDNAFFVKGRVKTHLLRDFSSETSHEASIIISTPFHSGVLVEKIDIKQLNKITSNRNGFGKTGEIILAYRDNNEDAVLFTSLRFENGSQKIVPKSSVMTPINQALLKNEKLFLEAKDYRNETVVATTRYMPEADIGMSIKMDTAEILDSSDQTNTKLWFFTAGTILAVCIVGIFFNILLTKSLRKEVRQKTDTLQATIADLKKTKTAIMNMMSDLTETNQQLKELDKAKTDFLNMASHELKTPLTAMSAYLDVLDDYSDQYSKEQLDGLEAIKRNSNQLKTLINNLLEVSRITSGKFELNKNEVDIEKSINNELSNLRILANNKGIKLNAMIDKLPTITTDELRFQEVINNLVGNAIKFTEHGAVVITAKREGEFVSVSVSDTGIGIPADKMKNLFETFYQVNSAVDRKFGGTGLGLSITKKIIESQGGKIIVTSEYGKGSTFSFILPIRAK